MSLLLDAWVVFTRLITIHVRNPALICVGLAQPLVYLGLYAPMLKTALQPLGSHNDADVYRLFVPGLLVMLAIFGGLYQGSGLIAEVRAGVIERCRATPVSRAALLLGRAFVHVAGTIVQAVFIMLVAMFAGLTVSLGALMVAFAILGAVALMTTCLSYVMILLTNSEELLSPAVNVVIQPLMFLSGVMLPLAYAPDWLRGVASWNPFTWVVDALRALFEGQLGDDVVWQSAILVAVLTAAMLVWTTRLFTRVVR